MQMRRIRHSAPISGSVRLFDFRKAARSFRLRNLARMAWKVQFKRAPSNLSYHLMCLRLKMYRLLGQLQVRDIESWKRRSFILLLSTLNSSHDEEEKEEEESYLSHSSALLRDLISPSRLLKTLTLKSAQ